MTPLDKVMILYSHSLKSRSNLNKKSFTNQKQIIELLLLFIIIIFGKCNLFIWAHLLEIIGFLVIFFPSENCNACFSKTHFTAHSKKH